MVLDSNRNLVSDKEPTPNKFTIGMGELIRSAREEVGISQAELARLIYRRQATLSDIENGKTEVSSGTLALLAAALKKPITYFYPQFVYQELKPEKFSPQEQELLTHFRNIWSNYLQKVTIDIIRVIAKFDTEDMLLDSSDIIKDRIELEEETIEFLKKRHKNK